MIARCHEIKLIVPAQFYKSQLCNQTVVGYYTTDQELYELKSNRDTMEFSVVTSLMLLLTSLPCVTLASKGDRYAFFNECLQNCLEWFDEPRNEQEFRWNQSLPEKLLLWDPLDECKYNCMWKTVERLHSKNKTTPQFYGKWPFVRVMGLQEPASVIFSFINGWSNVVGIARLRRELSVAAPMYWVWHGLAAIGVNAWIWSMVFHSRDTDFTEKMDYFCAFSLVLYMFFSFFARVLVHQKTRYLLSGVGVCFISLMIRHIHIMTWVKFDYGYNMAICVTIGLLNSVAWVSWGLWNMKRQRYVWKAMAVITCTNFLLLMELFDFPPFFWVFDAHSLWHAGTSLLPVLWFSFAVNDSKFLMAEDVKNEIKRKKGTKFE